MRRFFGLDCSTHVVARSFIILFGELSVHSYVALVYSVLRDSSGRRRFRLLDFVHTTSSSHHLVVNQCISELGAQYLGLSIVMKSAFYKRTLSM